MASKTITIIFFGFLLALCVSATFGSIECENLDRNSCAFAVSSTGARCVLEKNISGRKGAVEQFACRTSGIMADNEIRDFVETDACVENCGLDKNTLGISSDVLLDSGFTKKLCSSQCYQACPNVVDLYFNLAAGEGVFLPKVCESVKKSGTRRVTTEIIKSSGAVLAGGPEASQMLSAAEAPSVEAIELPVAAPAPM